MIHQFVFVIVSDLKRERGWVCEWNSEMGGKGGDGYGGTYAVHERCFWVLVF